MTNQMSRRIIQVLGRVWTGQLIQAQVTDPVKRPVSIIAGRMLLDSSHIAGDSQKATAEIFPVFYGSV